MGDQLLKEMEREVALLERERGIEAPNSAERPFSIKERLNLLEERIANLEVEDEEIEYKSRLRPFSLDAAS